MTAKELKDWADTLPPDATVQLMLQECAKEAGYTTYATPKDGGWVELDGRYLRVMREHPDRKPAQVADRLLK